MPGASGDFRTPEEIAFDKQLEADRNADFNAQLAKDQFQAVNNTRQGDVDAAIRGAAGATMPAIADVAPYIAKATTLAFPNNPADRAVSEIMPDPYEGKTPAARLLGYLGDSITTGAYLSGPGGLKNILAAPIFGAGIGYGTKKAMDLPAVRSVFESPTGQAVTDYALPAASIALSGYPLYKELKAQRFKNNAEAFLREVKPKDLKNMENDYNKGNPANTPAGLEKAGFDYLDSNVMKQNDSVIGEVNDYIGKTKDAFGQTMDKIKGVAVKKPDVNNLAQTITEMANDEQIPNSKYGLAVKKQILDYADRLTNPKNDLYIGKKPTFADLDKYKRAFWQDLGTVSKDFGLTAADSKANQIYKQISDTVDTVLPEDLRAEYGQRKGEYRTMSEMSDAIDKAPGLAEKGKLAKLLKNPEADDINALKNMASPESVNKLMLAQAAADAKGDHLQMIRNWYDSMAKIAALDQGYADKLISATKLPTFYPETYRNVKLTGSTTNAARREEQTQD